MVSPAIAATMLWKLNVQFPAGGPAMEQVMLRWIHIVFGTMWIGFVYFLNLVMSPTLQKLDGQSRGKIFPILISKLAPWFAASAGLTWLAGFRYFTILGKTDASNIGEPQLLWKWIGIWLACWVVASVILLGSLRVINNGWALALVATVVVAGTAWLVLALISTPGVSNRTLCIAVGGGMGTVLFVLGIVIMRIQKKIAGWIKAAADGAPMHPDTPKLIRQSFLIARMGMWLSFPMLFFMGASSHFPFLSGQ